VLNQYLSKLKFTSALVAVTALSVLGLAPGASAHTGEFAKFDYCPSTTTGVFKCLRAVTNGGKFILGKKNVPIVNPVTLQGGFSQPNGEDISTFFGATNGITLSKTPQPVPGGLSGLVNCKEISNTLLRISCEVTFENGLTGVNSTLELARPASEIQISEFHLIGEEQVALKLPVKVHLENPFLGSSCYVGSSSSPIILNLTTGSTAPPGPNTSIHGAAGAFSLIEGGEILHVVENEMVENTWSAPHASGCGGFLVELLLNPIIDSSVGLPSAAGKNTAILKNTLDVATAVSVNKH
jgi:hypothetical protein